MVRNTVDDIGNDTGNDTGNDAAAPRALAADAQHAVASMLPREVYVEAPHLLQRLVAPPIALLATKLMPPRVRPNGIARPRLTQHLHAGMRGALTVLLAPAGWGKTTLMSAWCAERHAIGGNLSAWVSLDQRDNDPRRFWRYVVAALERLAPGSTTEAQALLAATDAPSAEALLAPALNALRDAPDTRVLVLDDYHVIEQPAIHADLSFLIEHAPPHLHLTIASRIDLPLTLSRMRAQGLLTELHAADLRFTHEETVQFLHSVMRVDLAPEHVSALETRTEGWIAGLQLAALSLQSGQDRADFVQRFSGSHRFVLDYLTEEVLARQPPDVLQFLLRTSILERLSGPLCDAVTEQSGGEAMLERLDRSNLFIIRLDDERRLYRYHHLFADALRRHLLHAEPTRIATLHQRASRWYAEHGAFQDAVEHALAAGDTIGAATIIEQAWSLFCGQSDLHPTLRSWMSAVPERTIRSRPLLCLLQAVLLADHRDFAGAERWIQNAEKALAQADTVSSKDMHLKDMHLKDMNRPTRGMVAAIRASFAGVQGRINEAVRSAESALRDLPPENAAFRGTAMLSLGYAAVDRGDLPRAEHAFAQSMALSRAASSELQFVVAAIHLSYVQRAMGHLSLALQTCEEALAWVAAHGHQSSLLVGFLHVSLADLLRERNALDASLRSARDGVTFCLRWPDPTMQALSLLVLARVQMARGEFVDAVNTLAGAQRHAEAEQANTLAGDTSVGGAEDGASLTSLLRAVATQAQLAQGMALAGWPSEWPSDQGCFPSFEWPFSPHGYRSVFQIYIAEHAFIVPIQLSLARATQSEDAEALRQTLARVDELRQHAQTLGLQWLQIKAEILAALGYQALGAQLQARAALGRALVQAQEERYVRVFADEGAPLVALLDHLADRYEAGHETVSTLDQSYISLVRTAATTFAAAADRRPMSHASGELPDQDEPKVLLTAREYEVLQLLADGCSNEEIALALVVAIGTVKAHVQHIYRKLDAHSRTHALAHARKLRLLPTYEPVTAKSRLGHQDKAPVGR